MIDMNIPLPLVKVALENCMAVYGCNGGKHFYNNFDGKLPGGCKRSSMFAMFADKKYSGDRLSDKLRATTRKELFQDIDGIIQSLGIDHDVIKEQRKIAESNDWCHEPFWELVLPIYKELRELGYGHYDLRD